MPEGLVEFEVQEEINQVGKHVHVLDDADCYWAQNSDAIIEIKEDILINMKMSNEQDM